MTKEYREATPIVHLPLVGDEAYVVSRPNKLSMLEARGAVRLPLVGDDVYVVSPAR